MSAKTLCVSACIILGIAFLLLFFLSPPPPVYKYIRTESGEIAGMAPVHSKANRGEARVSVRLEDGTVVIMKVPTIRNIKLGQSIEVDVLEADGEKPRYRLAQNPPNP